MAGGSVRAQLSMSSQVARQPLPECLKEKKQAWTRHKSYSSVQDNYACQNHWGQEIPMILLAKQQPEEGHETPRF